MVTRGKQNIFGEEAFVFKIGEGKRCIYCSQTGHFKRDPPKFIEDKDKKCTKCKKSTTQQMNAVYQKY